MKKTFVFLAIVGLALAATQSAGLDSSSPSSSSTDYGSSSPSSSDGVSSSTGYESSTNYGSSSTDGMTSTSGGDTSSTSTSGDTGQMDICKQFKNCSSCVPWSNCKWCEINGRAFCTGSNFECNKNYLLPPGPDESKTTCTDCDKRTNCVECTAGSTCTWCKTGANTGKCQSNSDSCDFNKTFTHPWMCGADRSLDPCICDKAPKQGRAPIYGCAGKTYNCYKNPWTSDTKCTQQSDCRPYSGYSNLVLACADIIDPEQCIGTPYQAPKDPICNCTNGNCTLDPATPTEPSFCEWIVIIPGEFEVQSTGCEYNDYPEANTCARRSFCHYRTRMPPNPFGDWMAGTCISRV